MRDVDLINAIATRIDQGLAAVNLSFIPVLQKNQPNQQGIPTGSSIWIEKLFDQVYGSPQIDFNYMPSSDIYQEKETQVYNTTVQISAFLPQVPGDTSVPTASDLANYVKRWLTSRASIRYYRPLGCAIFRVTEVRNPKFEDDQSQFEMNPNFDIIFTHNHSLISEVGAVHRVEGQMYPVGGELGYIEDGTGTD